jgi:hypothetical protein
LPDAAQDRVLADHPTIAPHASISAIGTSKTPPPSRIGRPSAKIPKRPNPTIAGGIAEANFGLIKIDIFKENHRFSD